MYNEIAPIQCVCAFYITPGSQQRRWFRHLYDTHPVTWAQVPDSLTKRTLASLFDVMAERDRARFPNKGRKVRERTQDGRA